MRIRQAGKHMQTSLWGIARKARLQSKYRFGNLYSLLNEANLKWCLSQMNKKASPGVDAVSYQAYNANRDKNVQRVVRELKQGRYKAKLIRRRYIPKIGGRRPLGIPVVEDKLLQTAVAEILSAIYEQDFLPCSHGYRRGKGPQRAALELSKRVHKGRFGWVIDADIKGFFDNLNHEWLMRMLQERIEDRSLLWLIERWLKTGILEEDGKIMHPVTGTPQGGVVSAVLANIYLHYALDLWFERAVKPRCKGDAILMRYADDFVCCFQYRQDAMRYYKALGERLGKFGLELSAEKTRIIKFTRFETQNSEVFTFLGFEYRWGRSRSNKPLVKMQTAKKKFLIALTTMQTWIKAERNKLGTKALLVKLRQKLQGYFNYYGVSGNIRMLDKYYYLVRSTVFKWLNRRSQRRSFNWAVFNKMLVYHRIPQPRIIGYWD